MDFLPAIDIRSGRVVRLSQGEQTRQTVYGDDPIAVAEQFLLDGAHWIHVVDLDRAFGTGHNSDLIQKLIHQLGPRARVQLGGGFRSLDLVRGAVESGAARIVIGTAAALNPELVPAAVQAVGGERLAVAVDVRGEFVAVRGWSETSGRRAQELAAEVLQQGVSTLVYTNIDRDGMLSGADLAGAVALQTAGARVIASGGVAGLADIQQACAAGLGGIIVGRALYEGRLNLRDAVEAARCARFR
ncbi:MAG TPA: 1-(5-phosphoribosyl)-5-[(5-phosphoribosylamino)methylideneamino] imidazole-4-carboxamide isomerase [Gemmatimonadales bacterium]|nr:1-(5-phosphoribosyl)-5-[(5-phosphoribosylamino)methylideneamino] imidazole-4-carboxamide isomerase [Gemmatimonadales bacterium]